MAYDEGLAQRARDALAGQPGLVEKRMFGGVGLLLDGHLCVGVLNDDLILRLGPEAGASALAAGSPARPFDITGRAMAGWVMVGPDGTDADDDLRRWVEAAVAFVRTLPPKG